MKAINNIFEEKAVQMGHDIEALNAGHEVSSVIDVSDIDKLKALLQDGRRIVEQKEEEATMAFGELPPANANDSMALQKRMNHFVYGNSELNESEKEAVNTAFFPIKLLAISAKNKTIDEPTTLGAEHHALLVNYGSLNLGDSAFITIEGAGGVFNIGTLVRTSNAPATMGDINVLGRRGIDGQNGMSGATGANGAPGGNGGYGGNGQYGGNATDGFPSQLVTINITDSIQSPRPVIVYTCSGIGGTGGNGGPGGRGGDAGSSLYFPTTGGTGGTGGNGGSGGKSVDAAGNVMIYVAGPYVNLVQGVTAIAAPGAGGTGGKGGDPGSGPTKGQQGSNGSDGQPGTTSGAPAQIFIRPY